MKKITVVLSFTLLTMVTSGLAQSKKEVIYMRIQEQVANSITDSYLRVTYPDKPSKLVELSTLGKGGKTPEENGKKIQAEISAILNDGYELVSSSVGGDSFNTTTIVIFIRQK